MGGMIASEDAQRRLNAYIAERASRGLRSLAIIKSTDGGALWDLGRPHQPAGPASHGLGRDHQARAGARSAGA